MLTNYTNFPEKPLVLPSSIPIGPKDLGAANVVTKEFL